MAYSLVSKKTIINQFPLLENESMNLYPNVLQVDVGNNKERKWIIYLFQEILFIKSFIHIINIEWFI